MRPGSHSSANTLRMVALRTLAGLITAIFLPVALEANGEVLGPYVPDEPTLHLWHMDEPVGPIVDAVTNGLTLTSLENGATLGNESYLGSKGFGTALCTYTGNPNFQPGSAGQSACLSALPLQNGWGDNVSLSYVGPSGAFTYEAIVRIDFDPSVSYGPGDWGQGRSLFMQIICADADEAANRVFEFRLVPVGALNDNAQPLLEFINLNKGIDIQSLTAAIPTDGPDAIRLGDWYHVAVTYNGQSSAADSLHFYWTLVTQERNAANLIGSGQMTHHLPEGCRPDFAIGQTGRQSAGTPTPNNNFVGLIDEVRMSGVERPATGMLFGTREIVAKSIVPADPNTTPAPPGNASLESGQIGTSKHSDNSAIVQDGVFVRGPTDQRRLAILISCRDSDADAVIVTDSLKAHHAKASFFVNSEFLKWPMNETFAQTAFTEGHYVGPEIESWTLFAKAGSSPEPIDAPALYPDVEAHLKRLAGLGIEWKAGRFFLPKADQANSTVAKRGRDLGMIMITGTPGTLSHRTAAVEGTKEFATSEEILDSIHTYESRDANGLNGFLLLFQLDSGSGRKDRFYPHFDQLLNDLQKRGYDFVRVDELLNSADGPKMLSLGSIK